jgi:hypothetical protein
VGRVLAAAARPVSSSSVAVFRIGFGTVGALLVVRFFAHGWVDSLFLDPGYHFTYEGLEWIRPWPGPGMHVHFFVMGLAAACIAVGYRYRPACWVFASTLAYAELIDRTLYLNHYYWMVLTAVVMAFLPLDAQWSLGRRGRAATVPAGVVWLLRFQVGMVYFFAGLAKLNSDWLFRAEPLASWLPARSGLSIVGPLLTLPATAFLLSWAGALFDLTIVGWLSWRRTRVAAYVTLVCFHSVTWALFPSIGVFPLLMSLGATVFFEPAWPETWLRPSERAGPDRAVAGASPLIALVYCLVMVLVPLRHHFLSDDVQWTGQGYLASWQVMLTEKAGSVEFVVTDPDSGATWRVPPPALLTSRQVQVMATDPGLIRQAAQLVSAEWGGAPVAADARLSLNGRPSAQLTDPRVPIAPDPAPIEDWLLPRPRHHAASR